MVNSLTKWKRRLYKDAFNKLKSNAKARIPKSLKNLAVARFLKFSNQMSERTLKEISFLRWADFYAEHKFQDEIIEKK